MTDGPCPGVREPTAETPLHRAAAFGVEQTIQLLIEAGAKLDGKDMGEGSPLSWASWHLRPDRGVSTLCQGLDRLMIHRYDERS